ncbi:phytanoyl-CoA dioxygenase family protein [Candidatus Poribacteria bacterium]|nr:phytanoyl-CoA dioxygenase family protein [Candidatus Poribacteria bacterium]
MALSEAQKQFYWENGFLAVEDLIPQAQVIAMRNRIEELCDNWDSEAAKRVGVQQESQSGNPITKQSSQTVRKFSNLTQYEKTFRQHALNPALVDAVADLIGTPLSLYADQALLKPPLYGSEKPPHQDNAYFGVSPADSVITCWCALDDATLENGCMHYIPGSHKLGLVEHEKIENTPHLVPPEFQKDKAVAAPVRAGGCVFHHALSLHMSPPNQTKLWRRAFVCHYVRSDAQMKRDAASLLQVRRS